MERVIKIVKFEPLTIEWPEITTDGEIKIVLPNLHVEFKPGGILGMVDGLMWAGDVPMLSLTSFPASEKTTKSNLMGFLEATLPNLVEIHKIYQQQLNKTSNLHPCRRS